MQAMQLAPLVTAYPGHSTRSMLPNFVDVLDVAAVRRMVCVHVVDM
jgi:hypothetical protein